MGQAEGTGPHPRIKVRVCVPAPDEDQYWIVADAAGGWFAKAQISSSVSNRTYTVDLLNGSDEPGQRRHFLVVAGRTSAARKWLRANLDADQSDDATFPRADLPDGIDRVSASVLSTS